MKTKTIFRQYFSTIFIILLAACSFGTPNVKPTQDAGSKALSTQIASTVIAQITQTFSPSQTPSSTYTLTPAPTKTPASTQTQFPLQVVKGLRVTYSIKGNIYVQDSGGQPTKLTNSGLDWGAIISDDGHKIIFRRIDKKGPPANLQNIYSINADGSDEQVLVTPELLSGYQGAENDDPIFIPGTHKIIFNTNALYPDGAISSNNNLIIIDADTAEITSLRAPGQVYHFEVSPNGKMIAIQAKDHIDIINSQGQVLFDNLITYPYDENLVWMPMFWTQDSKQLIVLPPVSLDEDPNNTFYPLLYRTIWKYSLDGSKPVEIRLNPFPISNIITTSPDGKWIAYIYLFNPARTEDESKYGLYLGNLIDGTTKQLNHISPAERINYDPFVWNPISSYFMTQSDAYYQETLWSISGNSRKIDLMGGPIGWLDNNHYLYEHNILGEVDTDEKNYIDLNGGYLTKKSFVYMRQP